MTELPDWAKDMLVASGQEPDGFWEFMAQDLSREEFAQLILQVEQQNEHRQTWLARLTKRVPKLPQKKALDALGKAQYALACANLTRHREQLNRPCIGSEKIFSSSLAGLVAVRDTIPDCQATLVQSEDFLEWLLNPERRATLDDGWWCGWHLSFEDLAGELVLPLESSLEHWRPPDLGFGKRFLMRWSGSLVKETGASVLGWDGSKLSELERGEVISFD